MYSKGDVKIIKIYVVYINVSILNKLKINNGFFCKYEVNT